MLSHGRGRWFNPIRAHHDFNSLENPGNPGPDNGAGQSPPSLRTIALAAIAIALVGSLALGARIADRDCARLAGPGPWVSAPAWLADGLTTLRAEAYARCIAAEAR